MLTYERPFDTYHGSTLALLRFDPDQWWKTRTGVRIEIVGLQRLVLEVVLHPISF
jgi:hypothetical protein